MTSLTRDARFFLDGVTKYLKEGKTEAGMLPKVHAAFNRLSAEDQLEKTARVKSAVSLTTKEKNEISKFLSRLLTHPVTIKSSVDASCVGGIRITVGDWVVDTTIAGQIERMKTLLSV
jgi:F-type H+-transporting ATPase subunit delta